LFIKRFLLLIEEQWVAAASLGFGAAGLGEGLGLCESLSIREADTPHAGKKAGCSAEKGCKTA
jgi:hypothetical protein